MALQGVAVPILGYGALKSLLFVTYDGALAILDPSISDPTIPAGVNLSGIWMASGLGGLASWVVSAPSELFKCSARLGVGGRSSSLAIATAIWKEGGLRGLYFGGGMTGLRVSIGYGFYFWSSELSKRTLLSRHLDSTPEAKTEDVLLCGGIAWVVTWASVFPLDTTKTRMQIQLTSVGSSFEVIPFPFQRKLRKSALQIAREVLRNEGVGAFYRGIGICSVRAFGVNAVQVISS